MQLQQEQKVQQKVKQPKVQREKLKKELFMMQTTKLMKKITKKKTAINKENWKR